MVVFLALILIIGLGTAFALFVGLVRAAIWVLKHL